MIDTLEKDKVNLAFEMINKIEDSEYYLRGFRDYHNTLEYARKEAYQQGIEQGRRKVAEDVAQKMLKSNQNIELIAKITDLTLAEIEKLKIEIKGNK